jgi:hypothetical protein
VAQSRHSAAFSTGMWGISMTWSVYLIYTHGPFQAIGNSSQKKCWAHSKQSTPFLRVGHMTQPRYSAAIAFTCLSLQWAHVGFPDSLSKLSPGSYRYLRQGVCHGHASRVQGMPPPFCPASMCVQRGHVNRGCAAQKRHANQAPMNLAGGTPPSHSPQRTR